MKYNFNEMLESIEAKSVGENRYHGRCPCHDDRTPSLSVTQTSEGKILYHCHAGCQQSQLADYFSKFIVSKTPKAREAGSKKSTVNSAKKVWEEAEPLLPESDNAATRYLKNRGLSLSRYPATLRYHNKVYYRDNSTDAPQHLPGLVAKITDSHGFQTGAHRIYLTLDGRKADVSKPKKMLGDTKGSCVLLGDANATTWGVCEGIETALAIYQSLGITVAAALSEGNLRDIILPSHVEELHVFGDGDEHQVGQKAAASVAAKYLEKLSKIYVNVPDPKKLNLKSANADWLDVLNQCGEAAIKATFVNELPIPRPEERPISVCIADIEAKPVDWLMYPYIPKGCLTFLEGDPGLGKSHVSLAIAAALSRGFKLPLQDNSVQGRSLFFAPEDDVARTLRPRLERLGADLACIQVHSEIMTLDATGIEALEREVRLCKPLVVFFDPILAFVGKTDINRANEVRAILTQLVSIASRYHCAVVGIRHLSKGSEKGGNLLYRGTGSIDFTAAARSVLMVEKHPENENDRVVLHIKSNLSRPGTTLGFTFADDAFRWTDASSVRPETLRSVQQGSSKQERKVDTAVQFLKDVLADGPLPQTKILELALAQNLSRSTLFRAKEAAGVLPRKLKDGWEWRISNLSKSAKAPRTETVEYLDTLETLAAEVPHIMKNDDYLNIILSNGESQKVQEFQDTQEYQDTQSASFGDVENKSNTAGGGLHA